MIRIRQLPDASEPEAVAAAAAVLRQTFPAGQEDFRTLPVRLGDPDPALRPLLFVAEDAQGRVRGASLLLRARDPDFLWLDYLAGDQRRGGVGGALYARARETAQRMGVAGLFFEAHPDDAARVPDPALRRANARRLRFYAGFGALPVEGTDYETPVPGETGPAPPLLIVDLLGKRDHWPAEEARRIVRAILERRYARLLSPAYIDMVVASFRDDPVRLRGARTPGPPQLLPSRSAASAAAMPIVVNDRHDIHHVRERGYVEAPVRIREILEHLPRAVPLRHAPVRRFAASYITAVHDPALVDYLRAACAEVGAGPSVYPYVFPIRNPTRPPKSLARRAGYWCIDTFTPINGNAWRAARRGVDCTLTAASLVLDGQPLAYALVRPPGHHAERRAFGGFCYFNNAAIAAHFLSRLGRVAVLDIDYHHGNGTQDIFWERPDVLTLSIHGHPNIAYPYFSGFRDEAGGGPGFGFNLNLPLAENATPADFAEALDTACHRIRRFAPRFLVVAAGFDTGAGDPTGSWKHRPADFRAIGARIGALRLPTLVVQEGGYRTRTLGANAAAFFAGLWSRLDPGVKGAEAPPPAGGRTA